MTPTAEARLQLVATAAGAIVVALGVLFGGWSPLVVLALFWAENVAIGLLHVLRLVVAGARAGHRGAGVFTAVFFCVHYGLFTLVHGVFVSALFGTPVDRVDSPFRVLPPLFAALTADRATLLALAALAVSAVLDTLRWLQSDASHGAKLEKLMVAPYGRIIVLHVTLIGGGFLMQQLQAPAVAVLLLVVLKLWFDLRPLLPARKARPVLAA